ESLNLIKEWLRLCLPGSLLHTPTESIHGNDTLSSLTINLAFEKHTGKRNALGKEVKEESLKIVMGKSLRVLIFDEDHYDVVLVILL
ncbi:hypothetical protein Tco_1347523, partial [Tanacetum coccineum]